MNDLPPDIILVIISHLSLPQWAKFSLTNKFINSQSQGWNILLSREVPQINLGTFDLSNAGAWSQLLSELIGWKYLPSSFSYPKFIYSIYRQINWNHIYMFYFLLNLNMYELYTTNPQEVTKTSLLEVYRVGIYDYRRSLYYHHSIIHDLDDLLRRFSSSLSDMKNNIAILIEEFIGLLNDCYINNIMPYSIPDNNQEEDIRSCIIDVVGQLLVSVIKYGDLNLVKLIATQVSFIIPQYYTDRFLGTYSILNISAGDDLLSLDTNREIFSYLLLDQRFVPDSITLYRVLTNIKLSDYRYLMYYHRFSDSDVWEIIKQIATTWSTVFGRLNSDINDYYTSNLTSLLSRINLLELNHEGQVWKFIKEQLLSLNPGISILLKNSQVLDILSSKRSTQIIKLIQKLEALTSRKFCSYQLLLYYEICSLLEKFNCSPKAIM